MIDSLFFKRVRCGHDLDAVVVSEDVHDTPAVPVIRHSAAVVYVASRVLQNLQ